MYENAYDLTEPEKAHVQEALAEMSLRGGRLARPDGRPESFRILQGKRFVICDKGLLWRFAPMGSQHLPGQAGAAVRRNSAVEMWTGRWRKATTPDGSKTYAKCLVWVSIDEHVNGHAGISKLGWYQSEKGFKHPLAEPHAPSDKEVAALEGRHRAATDAVYARMQAEGLNVPGAPAGKPKDAASKAGRNKRRAS